MCLGFGTDSIHQRQQRGGIGVAQFSEPQSHQHLDFLLDLGRFMVALGEVSIY